MAKIVNSSWRKLCPDVPNFTRFTIEEIVKEIIDVAESWEGCWRVSRSWRVDIRQSGRSILIIQDCFWLWWHGPFYDTSNEAKITQWNKDWYHMETFLGKWKDKNCVFCKVTLSVPASPSTSEITEAARPAPPPPPPQPIQEEDDQDKTFMMVHWRVNGHHAVQLINLHCVGLCLCAKI